MKKVLAIFPLLFLFTQCLPENPNATFCTEEFRTVGFFVMGTSLDDSYTLRDSTGEKITFPPNPWSSSYFFVVDDSFHPQLKFRSETFTFIGLKNGQEIVRQPFEIGGDACHIFKISGPDTLKI